MVLMSAIWITRIVWTTGMIPDISGLIVLICSLYAINKAPDILGSWRGSK